MRRGRAATSRLAPAFLMLALAASSGSGATLLHETFESEQGVAAKGGWIYGKPVFTEGKQGAGLVMDPSNTQEGVRPGVSFPAGEHFSLEQGAVEMWVKPFADGDGLGTAYLLSTRDTRIIGEREWDRNRFVLYICGTGYRACDHLLFFVIWDRDRKPRRIWANVTSWKRNQWHKVRAEWKLDDGASKCRLALLIDDTLAANKPDDHSVIQLDGVGDWLDIGYRRHESGNVGQFWGVIDELKTQSEVGPPPREADLTQARRLRTAVAAPAPRAARRRELVENGSFEIISPRGGLPKGWRVPKAYCSVSRVRARDGEHSLRLHVPWDKVARLRRVKGRWGPQHFIEFGQGIELPQTGAARARLEVDVYAETYVPWFRVTVPGDRRPIECVADKRLAVGQWTRLTREVSLPVDKTRFLIMFNCTFSEQYGTLDKGEAVTLYIDRVRFRILGD